MPRKKTKLIVNPNADLGRAWRQASDLRPVVEQYGGADWSGTVYPTHAGEIAREAAEEGYELIISAGGDGTIHEVVNGVMQVPKERRPRLGVVPLGSGNDFAHLVGVTGSHTDAIRQVFTGTPKALDIGVVEDDHGRREYFDNTLGIGFDATVTIRSHTLPIVRGFAMYLTAVLQTIMLNHDAPRMEFKTDKESWIEDTMMIALCNGPREGGGFYVAPDAVADDGIFNYAAIRKVSRPMMLRILPEVMRGTHGKMEPIRMGEFKTMELTSAEPLHIHLDGEVFAGFGTQIKGLKVDILPGAIEVVS